MLGRFEKCMPTLLDHLRDDHGNGSKTNPFNEKGTLDDLESFSCLYAAMLITRKDRQQLPGIHRERFS
jgi:hypothetical protein